MKISDISPLFKSTPPILPTPPFHGKNLTPPSPQGFLNSSKGWWGNLPPPPSSWGRNQKFYWGDFFTGWSEPEEELFWWFKCFSKLKTAFCVYWTSTKIKINMTCVSKEYEIKTKMEQEQWLQLKILFLSGYNLKIVV